MRSNITSIVSALKILLNENPDSNAIPLLEDALKETLKLYLLDMGSMGQLLNLDDLEDEFKGVLKILEITNTK